MHHVQCMHLCFVLRVSRLTGQVSVLNLHKCGGRQVLDEQLDHFVLLSLHLLLGQKRLSKLSQLVGESMRLAVTSWRHSNHGWPPPLICLSSVQQRRTSFRCLFYCRACVTMSFADSNRLSSLSASLLSFRIPRLIAFISLLSHQGTLAAPDQDPLTQETPSHHLHSACRAKLCCHFGSALVVIPC